MYWDPQHLVYICWHKCECLCVSEVTAGLETVQRNLIRNLNELDFNRKFLQYHMSGVQFIGRDREEKTGTF